MWRQALGEESFRFLETLRSVDGKKFIIPYERWARILYDFACTFHSWPDHHFKLVNVMSPLYNARVASFINQTRKMDSKGAEAEVERPAEAFEAEKDYLLTRWDFDGAPFNKEKYRLKSM